MILKSDFKGNEVDCNKKGFDKQVGDRVDTWQWLKLEDVICAGIMPPGD